MAAISDTHVLGLLTVMVMLFFALMGLRFAQGNVSALWRDLVVTMLPGFAVLGFIFDLLVWDRITDRLGKFDWYLGTAVTAMYLGEVLVFFGLTWLQPMSGLVMIMAACVGFVFSVWWPKVNFFTRFSRATLMLVLSIVSILFADYLVTSSEFVVWQVVVSALVLLMLGYCVERVVCAGSLEKRGDRPA